MRLEFEQNLPMLPLAEHESPAKISADTHPAVQAMLSNAIESAQEGDRIEARRKLLRITEIEPLNETAWLWLASISEYPEELLIFLNNVLDINPENERAREWRQTTQTLLSKTFVERGVNAADTAQTNFAKQCFFQAVAHDANNETAWLRLAAASDTNEEKCSHLEKVMNINPNNEIAQSALREARGEMTHDLLRKANSSAFAGDFTMAKTAIEEVLQKSPESENAWLLKSYLTENFSDKMLCFEKILEINPRNETAHGNLNALRMMRKSAALAENSALFAVQQTEAKTVETERFDEPAKTDSPTQELEFPNAMFAENHSADNHSKPETTAETVSAFAENSFAGNSLADEPETLFAENDAHATSENVRAFFNDDSFMENPAEVYQAADEINEEPAKEFQPEVADFPEEKAFVSFAEQKEMLEMDFGSDDHETNFAANDENFELVVEQTDSFPPSEFQNDFYFSPIETESVEQTTVYAAQDETENQSPADYFAAANDSTNEFSDRDEQSSAVFASPENSFLPDVTMPTENEEVFAASAFGHAENAAPDNDFERYLAERNKEAQENSTDFAAESAANVESAVDDREETAPAEQYAAVSAPENYSAAMKSTDDDFAAESNNAFSCPFCDAENDAQSFSCASCAAILSLSDLEMLLGNQNPDRETIARTVNRMEDENNAQAFGEYELMFLGIGHLNLKNLRRGFSYLQQASQINPNNVLLSSQVNALAIRLEEIERKEEMSDGNSPSRTILVVDDSPTVRKLITGKLEKSGHEVVCAVDGMDALAKLEQIVPDLILLDITMPRMDGYQVCKMIRNNAALKDIPVVMISGKDGFFDKVRGRMAGTTGYITKPFGPETLMKALDAYIKNDVAAPVMVEA